MSSMARALGALSLAFLTSAAASPADRKLQEGGHLMEKRDFEAAIRVFDEALRMPPSDPARRAACHLNIGIAQANLGRMEAAMAAFRESIRADAEVPATHVFLGTCHRLREEWPEAAACFLEAIRLDPSTLRAHDELWQTYDEIGLRYGFDRDLIRREVYHIEKVLEADADYPKLHPHVYSKLKSLFIMHNRLQQAASQTARVYLRAEGGDRVADKAVEPPPALPDDGIGEEEKLAAFVQARYR
jgi:tetratricopeptide (TPR) repeat protein